MNNQCNTQCTALAMTSVVQKSPPPPNSTRSNDTFETKRRYDGHGGYNSAHREKQQKQMLEIEALAARETSLIRQSKWALMTLLILFAILVAAGAYHLLSVEEEANYEDAVRCLAWVDTGTSLKCSDKAPNLFFKYDRVVLTIETAINFHLKNIEGGMGRMSSALTAEAAHQNASWPFVTVPAFEVIGASAREQTGFEAIIFCPFVVEANVDKWQKFSADESRVWLRESRDIAQAAAIKANSSGVYTSFVPTDYYDGAASPIIVDTTTSFSSVSAGQQLGFVPSVQRNPGGPFLPIWMQTPPPFNPSVLNINFLAADELATPFVAAVLASRRPLFAKVIDMSALAKLSVKQEDHERYHSSLVKYKSNGTTSTFQHPHCPFMFPVFQVPRDSNSRIVAVLIALLPFDRYLVNLLPQGVRGIDAVVRNHRERQSFTYRLVGNSVSSTHLPEKMVDDLTLIGLRALNNDSRTGILCWTGRFA
jgi:hypothetical protein